MESKNQKVKCYFGKNCFRRKPSHFKEFAHPHLEQLLEEPHPHDDSPSILKLQWNIIKNLDKDSDVTEKKTENVIKEVEAESQDLDPTQKSEWRPFCYKGEAFELHSRFPESHMLGLKDGSVPTPPPSPPSQFIPNNQEYPWRIEKTFKCPLCKLRHTPPSSQSDNDN